MKVINTLLLLLSITTLLHGQNDQGIRTEADQMPYFSGCESYDDGTKEKRQCSNLALVTFIAQNIEYPELAKNEGLEGTVYVGFVIEADGSVGESKVLRDIGSGCGDAALEVLRMMPRWEPAHHQEKAVAVKLNIPIQFQLKEEEEPNQSTAYKINWGVLKNQKVTKKDLLDNLNKKVIVRDAFGNAIPLSNLRFSFERKRKFYEAQSTGSITRDMKKVVKKTKEGGVFVLTATLVEDGQFLDVTKIYSVVDK